MDRLTFISKMTESLAWPMAALIFGMVFRRRLLELLPKMRKFKAGPVEAEFELAAKQVLAEASEARSSTGAPAQREKPAEKPARKIVTELLHARSDPAGMILEGWSKIEGELFRFGLQLGLCDDPLESSHKVYSNIMLSDVVPTEIEKVIGTLRRLRNEVAHAKVQPTVESAQDYLVAVDNVIEAIVNYRKGLASYKPDDKV